MKVSLRMMPVALSSLLVLLPGCMSRTTAEDPLPGPVQEAALFAMEDGGHRMVSASVLLEGETFAVAKWFQQPNLLGLWLAEEADIRLDTDSHFRLGWPSYNAEMVGEVAAREPGRWVECTLEPFGGAGVTTLRISTEEEAPGFTRVRIEQWPFVGGMEGERVAEAHRRSWADALTVLRSAFHRGLPTTPAPPPIPLIGSGNGPDH